MIKNSKICITGGAGFIGTALTGRLCENNEVVILDTFERNSLKSQSFSNHKNITPIKGDVLNYEQVEEACADADYIVHCAGIAGISTVDKSPTRTMEVNIIGSINVLKAATKVKNCKRVLCFSTSEVFGSRAFSSKETDQTVIGASGKARWTYAVSKLAEEHLSIAYHKEMGVPATVVRPFNIYGPGQVGEGALKIFIEQALRDEPITIYGDGTQIRAWCYVDDMVDGSLLCLLNDKAIGESFNIGSAKSVLTIYGLANAVIRVLNSKSVIKFAPASSADIELRIPCVEKSKRILNFEAQMDLEKGILETAKYYQKFKK
jgi:UDP-glucose 4-epimerase